MIVTLALRSRSALLHKPLARLPRVVRFDAPTPQTSAVHAHADGLAWGADPRSNEAARQRVNRFYRHMALWTAQGWLAMFLAGSACAKLTEPVDLLIILLGWPESGDLAFVRTLGWIELAMAVGILAPLVSWRIGRPILLISSAAVVISTGAMAALHLMRMDLGFAGLNAVLAVLALAVFLRRRPTEVRS